MKTKYVWIVGMMAMALTTHAGSSGSGSHGGIGVVCRDSNGITSAELLDLFEARSESPFYEFSSEKGSVEENIQAVFEKLSQNQINGAIGDIMVETIQKGLSFVKRDFTPLAKDVGLVLDLSDSLPLTMKKNNPGEDCAFKQIANYETNGKLNVDMEIYNKLSHSHQAALKIHEALYKVVRQSKDIVTTKQIRKLVGAVFSSNSKDDAILDLMSTLIYPTPSSPNDKTNFSFAELTELVDYNLGSKRIVCVNDKNQKRTEFFIKDSESVGHELVPFIPGGGYDALFWSGGKLDLKVVNMNKDGVLKIIEEGEDTHTLRISLTELESLADAPSVKPKNSNAKVINKYGSDQQNSEKVFCWLE